MASLVIGKEVTPTKNPTNTFEFVISQMSGDGDAYNDESFKIQDVNRAVNFALLLECIKTYGCGYYETTRAMAKVVTETLSVEVIQSAIGASCLEDRIADITGYDSTSDGQFIATLDSYAIFWFNEFGIKFEVSLIN